MGKKKEFLPYGKPLKNVPLLSLTVVSNHSAVRHYFQDLCNKINGPEYYIGGDLNENEESDESNESNEKSKHSNSSDCDTWRFQIQKLFPNCNRYEIISEFEKALQNIEFLIEEYQGSLDNDEHMSEEDSYESMRWAFAAKVVES